MSFVGCFVISVLQSLVLKKPLVFLFVCFFSFFFFFFLICWLSPSMANCMLALPRWRLSQRLVRLQEGAAATQ